MIPLTLAFLMYASITSSSAGNYYFLYMPEGAERAVVRTYRAQVIRRLSSRWIVVRSDGELHGRGIYRVRKLKPLLDVAEASIGLLPSRSGLPSGCTGVVVGIVDTGIDLYHPDFIYDDGTNAFAYVWDQTAEGKPPEGFDYGLECTPVDINSLQCPVSDDATGHGTHIAGILASLNPSYPGVCTDAVMVFVKSRYDEISVIDAVCYVRNIADRLDLPFVVNLSLGAQYGPHDGTTPFEEMLSHCAGDRGVIVAAAGNDGDYKVHCGGNGSGGCTAVPIPILFSTAGGFLAELWSSPLTEQSRFVVSVSSDAGVLVEKYVRAGTFYSYYSEDYGIGITVDATDCPSPMNGDYHAEVRIYGPRFTLYRYFVGITSPHAQFRWDEWLTEGNAVWDTREGDFSLSGNVLHSFAGDSTMTINIPATSPEVIAVSSYVSRTTWVDVTGGLRSIPRPPGSLSSFSSRGPSRKNIYLKPDITAPGEVVLSAKATNALLSSAYVGSDSYHRVMWGTSVAAPFVSGIIARIMEGCRSVSTSGAKALLFSHAEVDSFTGPTPNLEWGWGKLHWSADLAKGSANRCFDGIPGIKRLVSDRGGEIRWELTAPSRVKVEVFDGDKIYIYTSSTVADTGFIHVNLSDGMYSYFMVLPGYRVTYGPFTLIISRSSPSCSFGATSGSTITFLTVVLALVMTFLPVKRFLSRI